MRQPFYATKEGTGSDANKVFIRANVSRRMVMHSDFVLIDLISQRNVVRTFLDGVDIPARLEWIRSCGGCWSKYQDFQKVVLEFFEFCKLCSTSNEVGVHQIRSVVAPAPQEVDQPAPEGIHRDGVDLVGIFCVNRERIEGGETYL